MAELINAERWLFGRLTGDSTLMGLVTGVYTYPIPASAVLPYVLISNQDAVDLMTMGGHRVWVDGLWVVRAVFETGLWTGNLEAAEKRIDALLHGAMGSAGDGNVWMCVRVEPFRLPENHAGQQLKHLGGLYRILVK